jgi:hypothetical protein
MLKLWCSNRLNVVGIGKCAETGNRFKFSCLACRMRRNFYGKFTLPPYYIQYTYHSFHFEKQLGNGKVLFQFPYVLVDPRGSFLSVRVAFIRVMDNVMKLFRRTKPFIEFAEFAANYPTW